MLIRFNEIDSKNDKISLLLKYFEGVVHDMKTPMSVILSILQSLEAENNLPSPIREQLLKIKKNCDKVLEQINNITDLTKISGGYFSPRYINYNIVFLAESVTNSITPLAARKNIAIIFDTNEEEKIMAVDKDIFERILLNLLSNAIKFAPCESVINVNMHISDFVITIDVIDQGCGIQSDMLELVFNRYETTSNMYNENGTGVGLSVVKELLDILDGSISAKQNPDGPGTVMHVELPVFVLDNDIDNVFQHYDTDNNILQIELSDRGSIKIDSIRLD